MIGSVGISCEAPKDGPKHDVFIFVSNIHPGRLTWNLQITHLERKMIFQASMIMFHVNLQGCSWHRNGMPEFTPLDLLCVDLFEMQPMVEFMIGLEVMVIDDQGNEGEKCWMIESLNQTCQVFTEPLWRASVVAQAKVGRVACWTVLLAPTGTILLLRKHTSTSLSNDSWPTWGPMERQKTSVFSAVFSTWKSAVFFDASEVAQSRRKESPTLEG